MRIALIAEVFLPKIDGVVHRTVNLVRELSRAGDEVLVVCPAAEGPKECPARLVEVPSFPFAAYPEYRVGLPDARVAKEVDQFRPDVVHFINPFAFGFRCYDVLRRGGLRLPAVFSFHTLYGEFVRRYRALRPLSRLLWWVMREYHNQADLNLTVSAAAREDLVRRGFERVELWPPAVDGELFHPRAGDPAMRARLVNGHAGGRLLLTVSRLAPEKNVDFLAGVLRSVPGACLAVVGDGPHRPELERRFAGMPAHFVGYLKGRELAAAYASADAFVYASETETMGNVVLEAMASGCAVVAPRAGGIPSLVDDGRTGLLYEPGDLEGAAERTRRSLADEALAGRLRTAARAWVEDRGWASSVGRVREVYREAAGREPRLAVRPTAGQRAAQAVLNGLVRAFRAPCGQ